MKKYLFYVAALGWSLSVGVHCSALAGVDVTESVPCVWLLHVGVFGVWFPVVLELRKQQDLQNGSFLERMNPVAFYRTVFKGTPPVLAVIGIAGFLYAMINFILFMQSQPGVASVKDGQYILHNHGQLLKTLTQAEYHHYKANEVRGFSGPWIAFYGMATAVTVQILSPLSWASSGNKRGVDRWFETEISQGQPCNEVWGWRPGNKSAPCCTRVLPVSIHLSNKSVAHPSS